MFFQANNKWGKPVVINSDAITSIELEAKIKVVAPGEKDMKTVSGVKIHFLVSLQNGDESSLAYEEFTGEQAEKLRKDLPLLLEAHIF